MVSHTCLGRVSQGRVTVWAQGTVSAPEALTFCCSSKDQRLEVSCHPLKETWPRGIHFCASLLTPPLFFLQTPHSTPDAVQVTS